jgi:hypothetical protein
MGPLVLYAVRSNDAVPLEDERGSVASLVDETAMTAVKFA